MQMLTFKPGMTSREVDKFIENKNPEELCYGKSGDQHILYVRPGKDGREAFEKMEISLNAVGKGAVARFRRMVANELINNVLKEIEGASAAAPALTANPSARHLAQFRSLHKALQEGGHLKQKGLFRVAGERTALASIYDAKTKVFQFEGVDLNTLSSHTLATLLKNMVRDFPRGVFGNQAGKIKECLKEIASSPPDQRAAKLAELGKLLARLPEENRQFFGECCALMQAVAAQSASNQMTLENLAAMFEQNLFSNLDVSDEDTNTSVRDANQILAPKLNAQQWGLVDYLNSLASGA